MADHGSPMGIRTIFVIVIVAGIVVGAATGILRNEFGGSVLVWGALAGVVTGGFASVLFRRRARALRHDD